MSKPEIVSVPATAESAGDFLYVWDDGDRVQVDSDHYRVLAFVGRYTTASESKDDIFPHSAHGTLTFDSDKEKKFVEGDKGHFTVRKRKDKDGTEYDVEVDITYFHNEDGSLIKEDAVFRGKGDLREGSGDGEWQWITRSIVPASAESSGDTLIVEDDAVADRVQGDNGGYRVLAFVGKYTTPAKNSDDLKEHTAKGTLTFDSGTDGSEKFVDGDKGTFTVTKTKDKEDNRARYYDVQVDIAYPKKESDGLKVIEATAVFKGKGDLREGSGFGRWEWITRLDSEKK